MKTGLVYSHSYLEHETGNHPENPGRLKAITSHLQVTGLLDALELIEPEEADEEAIRGVHSAEMIERVRDICKAGGGHLDADTFASSRSCTTARKAAGGVVRAIKGVMRGELSNAMALVRPPGHHATRTASMGFCLFNNIAIGARYLIEKRGLERVLCVDWDLHHGNGTQDIFYDSRKVFYFSIHQGDCYPGTGMQGEKGVGEGLGFTLNTPLPAGTPEVEYLERFRRSLAVIAEMFSPEFVLVSAGFDAHRDDPLGGLMVTEGGYAEMTRLVKRLAEEQCDGRLVSALEGGYHPDALAGSVFAHLEALRE